MMTKIGALIILLSITKTYTWFICPPSGGCRPMPVSSPCCNQQIPIQPQGCCNQQIPQTNNCNGCSSNNKYPQSQIYQTPSYLQPQQYQQPQTYQTPSYLQSQQYPQQMYQTPQILNQQQPQFQYQNQNNQYPSQQNYKIAPSRGGYPQAEAYVTPNPCYQIGKHKCCNQKLQFEMENFIGDYQNSGASMCNYNRLAKELQFRLESRFNLTFETVVSLGDFESKSYYEGHQVCKFERKGKQYLAYETPFENPEDMTAALEKDLGHPIDKGGYKQDNINNTKNRGENRGENFEFGNSKPVDGGKFQITDIGTSSNTQQKLLFTKSKI